MLQNTFLVALSPFVHHVNVCLSFQPPQLLETVKRFMTLRVKSDKEYAALLLNMTQQTEKQEAADYISTVSKVRAHLWSPLGGINHHFSILC